MEILDQNCEIQAPQIIENNFQPQNEDQKLQDEPKVDLDVKKPEQDAKNQCDDQELEKNVIYLNYDEANLQDHNQLEQIYLKEYRQILKLIQNVQLKAYDQMPSNETFKVGEGFIVDRGIISNMMKAIQMMNGIKNDPRNSAGISTVGNFQYFDGYLREDHSIGIRVIRVLESSSLNQEYQRYYPYILIHFYKKEKYPRIAYKKEYDQKKQRKLERKLQKIRHKSSESYTDNDLKEESVESNNLEQRTQFRRKLRKKFKRTLKKKSSSDKDFEGYIDLKEENNSSQSKSESSTPLKSQNMQQSVSQNSCMQVNNHRQQMSEKQGQQMQSFSNQVKLEACQKNKPSQAQQNQSYLLSNSSSSCTSLNQSMQIQNSYKKIKKDQLEQSYKKVQFIGKSSSPNQQQSQIQSQQLNNSFMNNSSMNQSLAQKEKQQAEQLNSLKRKIGELTNQLDSERYKALYFEDMYLQLRSFLVKQELNQLRANGCKYSASIEKKFQSEEQPPIKIEEEQHDRIDLD
ncbi:hypothetical protein ABPG74_008220 [Tetrahymena malaccensis]